MSSFDQEIDTKASRRLGEVNERLGKASVTAQGENRAISVVDRDTLFIKSCITEFSKKLEIEVKFGEFAIFTRSGIDICHYTVDSQSAHSGDKDNNNDDDSEDNTHNNNSNNINIMLYPLSLSMLMSLPTTSSSLSTMAVNALKYAIPEFMSDLIINLLTPPS
eukprot:scaffold115894_cov36-Cyclotella_meneghiniana.AAC.1